VAAEEGGRVGTGARIPAAADAAEPAAQDVGGSRRIADR
jgi:hypothetical protein